MIKLVLAFILLPVIVFGQTISGVVGVLDHGAPVTINGSGFETKQTAAPEEFETVESGAFSTYWAWTGGLEASTLSRHSNSTYCGTENMTGEDNTGAAYFQGPASPVAEKWFAQYWFYLDANFDWGTAGYPDLGCNLANVKLFRMWSPVAGEVENFHTNIHGWSDNITYYAENVSMPGTGTWGDGYISGWAKDTWHCIQFQYGESTQGANDGTFKVWFDGALQVDDSTLMTRDDESELKRPFFIGFYDAWGDGTTDRNDFYIDDVYTDQSWARVELGDNQVHGLCGHREIQPATAWADGSVTVTLNTGSFVTGETAYLFVTSESGLTSGGSAVIIGESGGGDVPFTAPTNFQATVVN